MTNHQSVSYTSELSQLIEQLMGGSPEEYRAAKREIERLWRTNTKAFRKAAPIVFDYLPRFSSIKDSRNQAAFCSGLSLFYLSLGDDHFDQLATFTLLAIQSPHGHVREAIRKASDWLSVSLTSRANPFVFPPDAPLSKRQRAGQPVAHQQYHRYRERIETLLDQYKTPDAESVEYIQDLRPSIYKSLQLLWDEIARIDRHIHARPPSPEILAARAGIEAELMRLIRVTQAETSIPEIEELIYEEQDPDDLHEIIRLFDTGRAFNELENIIAVVTDAWNHFPHRSLDGRAPVELIDSRE